MDIDWNSGFSLFCYHVFFSKRGLRFGQITARKYTQQKKKVENCSTPIIYILTQYGKSHISYERAIYPL